MKAISLAGRPDLGRVGRAEVQVCVEARKAKQPAGERLDARQDEFAPLPGQVFVCPHHGGKTGAVGEAERREIQHEDLRAVMIQDGADGVAQAVLVSRVELALQQQHCPSAVMFDDDGQLRRGSHQSRFR
jgi:hypothetical protein